MKNCPYIFIFFLLIFSCSNSDNSSSDGSGNNGSQNSGCDPIVIPDLNFKIALLQNEELIDLNSDGEIQQSEANRIEELYLGNKEITSLEGIQCFTQLKILKLTNNDGWDDPNDPEDDTYLTELDLSGMRFLNRVEAMNIGLTSINIEGCEFLHNLNIRRNYDLTAIDVSDNPNLEILNLSECPISTIDVSQNNDLRILTMEGCDLTNLDLSNNSSLYELRIQNNNISEIDFPNQSNTQGELWIFSAFDNALTELDLSFTNNFYLVECDNNNLGSLVLGEQPILYSVFASNNNLTTLDLSGEYPFLERVSLNDNQLTSLDFSNCTDLRYFQVSANNLEFINLKNGTPEFLWDSGCLMYPYDDESLYDFCVQFRHNPNLTYICTDAEQVDALQQFVDNYYDFTNLTIDSNCN